MASVETKNPAMAMPESLATNSCLKHAKVLIPKDFEDYLPFFWEPFSSFQPLPVKQVQMPMNQR